MAETIDIKAADVQKLRQTTGAGLMDCKQALKETSGDMEKAIRLLREKGIAKSSKRSDRTAAEGLVESWVSADQKEGILLEMNCETDFVARNEEFIALAKNYIKHVQQNPSWTSAEQIPQEEALALSGKIGEKMLARRFVRMKAAGAGVVTAYIHSGAKLGVLIQIDSEKQGAPSEAVKELARELAIQIAGANPLYISREEIPADVITREKEIAKKQLEGQNKPAEMLEKIATGKLSVFFEANCLLDQPHVRDASGKVKIQNLVDDVSKKEGAPVRVSRFVRFRVGAD